jgi:hypothetical protein
MATNIGHGINWGEEQQDYAASTTSVVLVGLPDNARFSFVWNFVRSDLAAKG